MKNERLAIICENYRNNMALLKSVFRWESAEMYAVCAAQLTGCRRVVGRDDLLEAKRILKAETGVFSSFRSSGSLSVISALAMSEYPTERMLEMKSMYQALRESFGSSTYLAMAAVILSELISPNEAGPLVVRARELYNRMRSEHPFLTSSEDSVLAVLLAFSGKSDEELIGEMETTYTHLKASIHWADADSVQTVSHILALGDRPAMESADRFLNLFQGLQADGHRYGREYELSALAVLAITEKAEGALLCDVQEANDFLGRQKGYGGVFGFTKKTRLMHAAMLVSLDDDTTAQAEAGVLSSTLAMMAARQAAMCAVMASVTAASVSARNS